MRKYGCLKENLNIHALTLFCHALIMGKALGHDCNSLTSTHILPQPIIQILWYLLKLIPHRQSGLLNEFSPKDRSRI